jgi:hypothetical protein
MTCLGILLPLSLVIEEYILRRYILVFKKDIMKVIFPIFRNNKNNPII